MQLEVGSILEGKVTGIAKFGAFVEVADGVTGMVHISEVSSSFVNDIHDHLSEGQTVKVKVMSVEDNGKIALSIKKAEAPDTQKRAPRPASAGPKRETAQKKRAPRPAAEPVTRPGDAEWEPRKSNSGSFEEMMSRFKQDSDEKLSGMKKAVDDRRTGYHRK